MKALTYFAAIAGLLSMSSCEKAFFEKDLKSRDPYENFNYLWKECNEKYAYFDLKGVDWAQVKKDYETRLYAGMSEDSLFSVLGGMLNELRDDHTNLVSTFNVSSYGVRYHSPDNFDWRIVEDHYLPRHYYQSGPFAHDFIAGGAIGYIRFASFTGTVDDKNLDFMLERYKDTRGLILDIRENGGGSVQDVFHILSRFVDQETLVNYTRIKKGPAHDDFSDPAPVYVKPHDGIRYTRRPVAVLTDRGTFSAASFTSLATKAIPNVMLIGDSTGGGLGLPNGGQLPNGWTYRFSITQALTLDKEPGYEQGVPPDIRVLTDLSNRSKDAVIDRAIAELMK